MRVYEVQIHENLSYRVLLVIIKRSVVFYYPMFSELQVENVLDLMERDVKSTQALLYLFGILYCLLRYDKNNIYAKILWKTRNLNRIIEIYILDHNYNPNFKKAVNIVMYYLYEKCDDSEKREKISGSSIDDQIFDSHKTA